MAECTPEITALFTRITEVMELLGKSKNFYWISSLLGLVGVILGFSLSYIKIFFDNKKKKNLLYHLLNDEICRRWENEIKDCIFSKFDDGINWEKTGSEWEKLKTLEKLSNTPISPNDFPIIENFSHSFDQYTFIRDKSLVSSLIFGHIRLHDLFDCFGFVKEVVNEMKNVSSAQGLSDLNKSKINRVAMNYKKFLDEIHKVLTENIWPKLGLPKPKMEKCTLSPSTNPAP